MPWLVDLHPATEKLKDLPEGVYTIDFSCRVSPIVPVSLSTCNESLPFMIIHE